MKRFLLVFVTILLTSCSFDNKTGIWKDASSIPVENKNAKSISKKSSTTRLENVFIKNQVFNKEIDVKNTFNIQIDSPIKISNWVEQYGIPTNNISNFFYSDKKILLSKSSKLSKNSTKKNNSNQKIIFYKNNLISYDHKGTIFIYSLTLNKKIFEYNFYKKEFKNFKKEINFIINENILYSADNLGYLYAINLDNKSIIWAKNYGIPFRSNLKFAESQIFLANQDNVIYSIDSTTGNKNWQFATSITFLKSNFKNNFALDLTSNNLIFLNTSGELYSINYFTQKINWVLNFKNPLLSGDVELFLSQPLVIKNDNLIISTEKSLLSYNILTSSRNWILSSEPIFKPVITSNYTYAILKNNLLICLDNLSGKVIWSKNIFKNINNEKFKNKFGPIIDFKIVNNKINIYSKNGYLLTFNFSNGNLNSSTRINKSGIISKVIFLNNNMFFVDKKNKLLKFN
jgi:outer membrane protein assembly factor BamB